MHAERPTTSKDKTRELQRELYLAAKRSRNRRFHAPYDRIFRPDILWRAWGEVRRNGGSAGVDGVTIEEVEREGVGQFLGKIEQDLKAKVLSTATGTTGVYSESRWSKKIARNTHSKGPGGTASM